MLFFKFILKLTKMHICVQSIINLLFLNDETIYVLMFYCLTHAELKEGIGKEFCHAHEKAKSE